MYKPQGEKVFPPEPGKQEKNLHDESKDHKEEWRVMYKTEEKSCNNYYLVLFKINSLKFGEITCNQDQHNILLE